MTKNEEKNKPLEGIISFGLWVYNIFMLQIYWILYSLKGFIIAGIFPAFGAVATVIYKIFQEKEINFDLKIEFKKAYESYFKKSNRIGYVLLLIFVFLYIDLRISQEFIQSFLLHNLLLLLVLIALSISVYTFTVMIRYDYDFKNIIKQSFYVSLSVPTFTLAAIIGLILMGYFMISVPFVFYFFGIPLLLFPVIWFTYTGCLKAEERREELDS